MPGLNRLIIKKDMMTKIRVGLIALAITFIILNLTFIDYSNLSWSENRSPYGQILAFCILIAGLIYSIRHDEKKRNSKK
jgi:hypothetical protein